MSTSNKEVESHSNPSINVMSSSPTKSYRERDTGFPEPLDGVRNTTLPHPDADLSPNATISQDDISAERNIRRTRRSFLQKHRRTVSHGFISPHTEAIQSILTLSMLDVSGTESDAPKPISPTTTSTARFSNHGNGSMGSIKEKPEETPPSSPELSLPDSPRRKSVFGRWRRK